MVKIKLSKEQMDRLKELGVDTSKSQLDGFTLSELLEMFPEDPYEDSPFKCEFRVNKSKAGWFEKEEKNAAIAVAVREPIDMVYELLELGLERGYIKPNNE